MEHQNYLKVEEIKTSDELNEYLRKAESEEEGLYYVRLYSKERGVRIERALAEGRPLY